MMHVREKWVLIYLRNKFMKEFYKKIFKNTTSVIISVFACTLLLGGFAFATTVISTDILTGGTLGVTGLATFDHATSTSATTTAYLYVGPDGTEPSGWNFTGGDLIVMDDAYIGSQATTSASLWVGSGGTASNINLAGGDLYVQNDAEIDGALYVTGLGTFTGGIDTAGATTDITLQNDQTIANVTSGNITFGTTAMSMATTTATTTGSVWVSAPAGVATSTVIIGGGEAGDATTNSGCLELWRENLPFKVYIDTAGTGLKVVAGRCKD